MVALIGREAELRRIEDHLATDPPTSIVLTGGAGVGKSRVADEVAERLSTTGRPVRSIRVTEALATIPLGAFAELLPPEVPVSSTSLELFRAVRMRVAQLGAAPPVLVIDDGHLLDAASAALVHQLVSERAAAVLLTHRTGTTVSDAVTRLWTDGLAERIDLQSLSRAEVRQLVESMLGGAADEDMVARLTYVSDGNVLYVCELVELGREQGAIRHEHGAWHWTGNIVPSGRLGDLIEQALARAEPDVRDVLDVVALSEPVGSELIAGIVGEPTLERTLRSRFLINDLDGSRSMLRLAHPLFAESLRRGLEPARQRRLSRQLAEALRASPCRRRTDRIRLPEWLLDGGVADQQDADILARAAWETYGSAPPLAERFARAAIDGGAGLDALLALAGATNYQGRFEDSVRIAAPLLDRATTDADRRRIGGYVGRTLAILRRADEAEAFISRAEERCDDPSDRLYLAAIRADVVVRTAQLGAGRALAEQIMADPAADDETQLRATATTATALIATGQVGPALALLRQVLPRAVASIGVDSTPGHTSPEAFEVVGGLLDALQHAGRLAEAATIVENIQRFADASANHEMQAAACFSGGPVVLRTGRAGTAAHLLRRFFRLAGHDTPNDVAAAIELAQACAMIGDLHGALEAERSLCKPSTTAQLDDAEIARAKAWVAVAAGELSRAAAALEGAADTARTTGLVVYEAAALHDLWRVTGIGHADRLDDLASQTDGAPWVAAYAATAHAAATDDPSSWEEAANKFASIGAKLHAAEAWATGGAANDRAGLRAAATRARAQATMFAAQCEGARTPVLRTASLGHVVPLTRRETEMVELAARGLTNRDIAERLLVSVRTVEGHLARAYAKLGTNNRGELALLLGLHST